MCWRKDLEGISEEVLFREKPTRIDKLLSDLQEELSFHGNGKFR